MSSDRFLNFGKTQMTMDLVPYLATWADQIFSAFMTDEEALEDWLMEPLISDLSYNTSHSEENNEFLLMYQICHFCVLNQECERLTRLIRDAGQPEGDDEATAVMRIIKDNPRQIIHDDWSWIVGVDTCPIVLSRLDANTVLSAVHETISRISCKLVDSDFYLLRDTDNTLQPFIIRDERIFKALSSTQLVA